MADIQDQLRESLRGRYLLEREIGRGGTAVVYLAHDVRHDRPVALKVLHPDLAAKLGTQRFLREIRLTARLQHPHILPVHDSGEAAGQLWYTMPYVEGESLRNRLRRERQLPIGEAIRITREAADALDYAHRHGVIHRDIKPENILLSEGHALVADFGTGRAVQTATLGERITETGTVVGTPHYMSPEQASGERELDARTDVYSLGAVLYEMLAGEPPFSGATVQQLIAKRFTEPVPTVRGVRRSVPKDVDQAVRKAMAPAPANRFASAAEFAGAIRAAAVMPVSSLAVTSPTDAPAATPSTSRAPVGIRRPGVLAAALALGLLICVAMIFAWRRSQRMLTDAAHGPQRLAVLPFENLGDPGSEHFADGITDEVRGKLASLPGLEVIASQSSSQYKHTAKRLPEIARELGVEQLLTGKVRWEAGPSGSRRVRVSPELVVVTGDATPTTRWQQAFEASLTDVFKVQADIADRVADALNIALGAEQKQVLAAHPTASLAAYEIYLRAEAVSLRLAAGAPLLQQAIGLYEQAITLDSSFIEAWAQSSRAHSAFYLNGTPTPKGAEAARRAAQRALALDPARPEGHLALGDYHWAVRGDNPRAVAAYGAGLGISPDNTELLSGAALAEQSLGRWDAALTHFERARTLDPRSVRTARRHLIALTWLHRYPDAEAAAVRALALAPENAGLVEIAAQVRLGQGDLAGARTLIRAALSDVDPSTLVAYFGSYWDLMWVLEDEQQRLLLQLPPSAFAGDRAVWAMVRAQTYHLRGNRVAARAYADSARLVFEEQLRGTPDDAQRHLFLGLALAYLGRKGEAIETGERGLALKPIDRDRYGGPYNQHQLVRIYLLVDEPERALDRLEPLLKLPYYLSPQWLRIDPTFDPLRGNLRFERLIAGE